MQNIRHERRIETRGGQDPGGRGRGTGLISNRLKFPGVFGGGREAKPGANLNADVELS